MNWVRHWLLGFLLGPSAIAAAAPAAPAWPPITRECRPWAYNWWLGSAVDRTNLRKELQRYRDGGLGGIHIIPIYGAKGAENRYLEYLSPAWMEMLDFTVSEANRLDLGVDMTTGTGWCFGGPNIPKEMGGWKLQTKRIDLPAGRKLTERFDPQAILALLASGPSGEKVDLREKLNAQGQAPWEPAGGPWKVYAVTAAPGERAVKRAAPGGAGPMINPLDPAAMRRYLERFTDAFAAYQGLRPRAMYHDSYEYISTWMPAFADTFARRRGYRLEDHWPAFCGDPAQPEFAARVRHDYRETVSDLIVEEVFPLWAKWTAERKFLTRNQAHGAPANLLDFYALADIPETEMFGRGQRDPLKSGFDARFGEGDRDPLISKFASSAAHVAGKRLVAAETGTWMAEHFCETLEELKCFMDLLFCAGVNQVIYHGCCYSPDDAAWPGWLFYASTQMNPRNPIWHDAPALNQYAARCQAVLQSGQPDNDVLLYWPIHDLWQTAPGLLVNCSVHNHQWLDGQPLGAAARRLWRRGFGFDYVSDRQLAATRIADGKIQAAGASYKAVVAPNVEFMPVETLRKLLALAAEGGVVIFEKRLPRDVPGLAELEPRRAAFRELLKPVTAQMSDAAQPLAAAQLGRGWVLVGDLEAALDKSGVRPEPLAEQEGTLFIRRSHPDGCYYFIANQGNHLLSGWQTLATPAAAVAVLDPMTGAIGEAPIKRDAHGRPQVFLRLEPGHSIILQTFRAALKGAPPWRFDQPGQPMATIDGPWTVRFLMGGPQLPAEYQTNQLASWTLNGDPRAESFGGTAVYAASFAAPDGSGPWLLDLGRVCHSARVRLNGRELGTLLMSPYRLRVDELMPRDNRLEVEVTNLGANRIRDLDRRKVAWRYFHEINLVNIAYQPFDASSWPVMESGLLGPVRLLKAQAAEALPHQGGAK